MNTETVEIISSAVCQAIQGEQLPQNGTAEHEALGAALAKAINSEDLLQIGGQTVNVLLDTLMAGLQCKRTILIAQFRPKTHDD